MPANLVSAVHSAAWNDRGRLWPGSGARRGLEPFPLTQLSINLSQRCATYCLHCPIVTGACTPAVPGGPLLHWLTLHVRARDQLQLQNHEQPGRRGASKTGRIMQGHLQFLRSKATHTPTFKLDASKCGCVSCAQSSCRPVGTALQAFSLTHSLEPGSFTGFSSTFFLMA